MGWRRARARRETGMIHSSPNEDSRVMSGAALRRRVRLPCGREGSPSDPYDEKGILYIQKITLALFKLVEKIG